jgi:hypothetical protein
MMARAGACGRRPIGPITRLRPRRRTQVQHMLSGLHGLAIWPGRPVVFSAQGRQIRRHLLRGMLGERLRRNGPELLRRAEDIPSHGRQRHAWRAHVCHRPIPQALTGIIQMAGRGVCWLHGCAAAIMTTSGSTSGAGRLGEACPWRLTTARMFTMGGKDHTRQNLSSTVWAESRYCGMGRIQILHVRRWPRPY